MSSNVIEIPVGEATPLSTVVAANIRAEMARYNVSRVDLARVLGVTQQAVSLKLRGKRPLALDELEIVASYLQVEPADLLARQNPRHGGAPSGGSGGLLPRLDSNQQPSD